MLYGKCRKVLDAICFLCMTNKSTTTLDIVVYLHNRIQDEDLIGCLQHLASDNEGYIYILENHGGLLRVALTHKGKHYKEVELANLKRFLLTSLLVPIIVSVLTTAITLWLQGIL